MPDYSKGKIYKITNSIDDEIYIGSTVKTLKQRLSNHLSSSKNERNKSRLIRKIKEIGDDKFNIELIENFPSNSKDELVNREAYFIKLNDTYNNGLNGRIDKRTDAEYYLDNKTKINKQNKEYSDKNKNKKSDSNKLLYHKNKSKIIQQHQEWRENNKEKYKNSIIKWKKINNEKINMRRRELYKNIPAIECECGGRYKKGNRSVHFKTTKHLEYMNSI